MNTNIMEEYLVKIGFTVDKQAINNVRKTMDDIRKNFANVALGVAAATGGVVAFTAAISAAGNKLGNITTGVDKFALSLYTTQKNARSLQQVMGAMGIDSLEDLKYINLMPEQRQQFMELRKLSEQLAPDEETKKGLDELRKLGFQFQKMQIEMSAIGLRFLGTIGKIMATPLFKIIPPAMETVIALIAWIGKMIEENVPKHPKATIAGGTIGGILGGIGGRTAGAWAGGAIGGLFGPEAIPIGASIGGWAGGILGAGGGGLGGIKAGSEIAEHKQQLQHLGSTIKSQTKALKKEIEKKIEPIEKAIAPFQSGHHSFKAGVKTTPAINNFLQALDQRFKGDYIVTSGLDHRSGSSWHPKGLAADIVPKNTSIKGYADLVSAMLASADVKKVNLELSLTRYLQVQKELLMRHVNYSGRLTHQITKDFTGEHAHATLRPVQNISFVINGARDPRETANQVGRMLQANGRTA